ncbi:MAG TPA: exodeoxyribonuclease I, partial [Spongiibacteraceae bacterium]|nr:exodeoxyribonuclease I [Spongiibacteraceae bacterium]
KVAQKLLRAKNLAEKLCDVFVAPERTAITDPEQMLYSGGFFSNADRATMNRVRAASARQLAAQTFVFEDKRLPEMLFRYRARNFPETLSGDEQAQWAEFCALRLRDRSAGASIVFDEFYAELQRLGEQPALDARKENILRDLANYADEVATNSD